MYTNSNLIKVWALPPWVHYLIAVIASLAITLARIGLSTVSEDRIQFLFFTFSVCLSAFVGGLGPGLLAAALAIVLGTEVLPRIIPVLGPPLPATVLAFVALWVFVSYICDVMRRASSGFRTTLQQRDEKTLILEAILQQTSDGLLTVDRKRNITLSNESFGQMCAVLDADLIGASIHYIGKLLVDGPDWDELCEEAHREGRAGVDVETIGGKWLNFRVYPGQDNGCSLFVQDITIRKHLELSQLQMLAAERSARSKAEEANRLKDGFLAMLSHELRTPLTSILGWTELLTPMAEEGSLSAEGLAAILRSTQSQKSLIDQLLDMSRITTGKLVLDRHLLDIGNVVDEAVNGLRPSAQAKGIELKFEGLAAPCVLSGDEARLVQIINNLVTNAIKFSASGTTVEVDVRLKDAEAVVVSVRDHGEGIAPDLLGAIFDPFQQADSSITRQHGGLGLGLALAKQLTLQHDGKISAFSEGPGKGATFEVTLPIKGAMRTKEPPTLELVPKDALLAVRVLLVEDDDATRSVLAVILRNAGAIVMDVDSGLHALQVLAENPIDILVSDIGMPLMDGYELIKQVRKLPDPKISGVLALSLSAFAFSEDVDAAISAGFNACLTKPITATTLVRELSSWKQKGAAIQ